MFNFIDIRKIFGNILLKLNLKSEKKTIQVVQQTNINNTINMPQIVGEKYTDLEMFKKIKEENYKQLSLNIQNIPKEKLVPLEPYKSMKALQVLQYVSEEKLSEMFIELLSKSADSRYANKVRAGYQEIISALDPDDAKLLEFMFRRKYTVKLKLKDIIKIKSSPKLLQILKENPNMEIPYTLYGIPFLEIRKQSKEYSMGWQVIHKIFTDTDILAIGKSVGEIESQFEYLSSLGLLEISSSTYLIPSEIYSHLENKEALLKLDKEMGGQCTLNKVRGKIELTTLGKNFLSIVLKDRQEENNTNLS